MTIEKAIKEFNETKRLAESAFDYGCFKAAIEQAIKAAKEKGELDEICNSNY
jgi:hypothetical protein